MPDLPDTAPSLPLSALGEEAVLHRLLSLFPPAEHDDTLITGPGDDCAVMRRDAQWDTLLKTDALVEGVHFLPGTEPRLIGRKALARAVSDIAAMGGLPEHALVTLMAHHERPLALLEGIYSGMAELASEFGISLAGGETSSLPDDGLALSVTLIGRVERGQAVLRSGGKPGDILCVSGALGGSFTSGRHLDFTPRVALARELIASGMRPHAMMDISDGLARDLPRLARASGCDYELHGGSLPLHPGCSEQQALSDGEDYELLVALPPEFSPHAARYGLSVIGRLVPGSASDLPGGWQHFAAPHTLSSPQA